MTEQETRALLELAAKAIGISVTWANFVGMDVIAGYQCGMFVDEWGEYWNPLEDDGDALRLAAKLEMQIVVGYRCVEAVVLSDSDETALRSREPKYSDPYGATRRAIVRAAAEIGRVM